MLGLAIVEYSITWRATDKNANADTLSRLPLSEAPAKVEPPAELVLMMEHIEDAPVLAKHIEKWTSRNPVSTKVYQCIHQWWSKNAEEELKPYWHRCLELSMNIMGQHSTTSRRKLTPLIT